MKKLVFAVAAGIAVAFVAHVAHAEEIGSVDTALQLLGPNHKIVVEGYDDPAVQGVSCHLSRAVSGGIGAAFGLSTDKSDASIACRQLGPISFNGKIPVEGEVFSEKLSPIFKQLHVVRIVDRKRNTLVYLTFSTYGADGSPKNSVSTVPVPTNIHIPVE